MSKLQDLINRLCPDGVPFKPLGEVCEIKRGVRVTKEFLDKQNNGYPVYQNSLLPLGFYERWNCYPYTTFIIGAGAAGDVGFSDIQFWAADDCFYIESNDFLISKYVYYFLTNCQYLLKSQVRKASVPRISREVIKKLLIPVPPLEVQEEIVRILDYYSDRTAKLQAQLQAELQARKEQYEYYRNLLLTFDKVKLNGASENDLTVSPPISYEIQWKKMGEICDKAKNIKWKEHPFNNYKYIDLSSVDCANHAISSDLLSIDSSNAPSRAQQIVHTGDVLFGTTRPTLMRFAFIPTDLDGQICSTGYAVLRARTNIILSKYLYFILNTKRFYSYVENNQEGAGYPSISMSKLEKFLIPIPPLEVQEKIVAILDRFETLVNDLSQGLPAEIEAVREQYEYYRNQLLTFKQLA